MDNVKIWIPLLLTFLAGISTAVGSFISLFVKELKPNHLKFSIGVSAGVMIYVSFAELLRMSIQSIGFFKANIWFFFGMALIMLLDFIVPHKYIEEQSTAGYSSRKLYRTGLFTALGVSIHNVPEGLAVFMSSLGGVKLGVALAFAIGIHNIPEGFAIAMPIYYATKNKNKAFWYSFLSGFCEPVGALIGILFLSPFASPGLLAVCFAFAAGIMVFVSFDELLPVAYKHQENHIAIAGIITGMLIMAVSLNLL